MFIVAEREYQINSPKLVYQTKSMSVILMLRLYAMYFRDKRVLLMISLVCAGAAGGSIYVMVRALMVIGGKSAPSLLGYLTPHSSNRSHRCSHIHPSSP